MAFISLMEENGGEVNEEMMEDLAIRRENFLHKAESYSKFILKLDSDTDVIDAEIKRLQSLKKAKANTRDRLKETLLAALQVFGMEDPKTGVRRYETTLTKLSTRRSTSVEITDEAALPESCFVVKREVSKTAIKNLLDQGVEIEGAAMKENLSLQIR
jgi:hypothetical protein